MKKVYRFTTSDKTVIDFFNKLGHKKGAVIEAMAVEMLKANNGYLSPMVMSRSKVFYEPDEDFVLEEEPKKVKKTKNRPESIKKAPKAESVVIEDKKTITEPVAAKDPVPEPEKPAAAENDEYVSEYSMTDQQKALAKQGLAAFGIDL